MAKTSSQTAEPQFRIVWLLMRNILLFAFIICTPSFAQESQITRRMDAAERDRRIQIAENGEYMVRRLEFEGNTYTRDKVVRKVLWSCCAEGNIFTRKGLENGLRGFSKKSWLFPVTIADVEVFLDDSTKDIDIVVHLREKRKR